MRSIKLCGNPVFFGRIVETEEVGAEYIARFPLPFYGIKPIVIVLKRKCAARIIRLRRIGIDDFFSEYPDDRSKGNRSAVHIIFVFHRSFSVRYIDIEIRFGVEHAYAASDYSRASIVHPLIGKRHERKCVVYIRCVSVGMKGTVGGIEPFE